MNSDYKDLRAAFRYEPDTGLFFHRKKQRGRARPDMLAGTKNSIKGSIDIRFGGRRHKAHRLAWLYVTGEWPLGILDHINRDPFDNRISNLRVASRCQNLGNMGLPRDNVSGVKGVNLYKRTGKWRASISNHGKAVHLGYFETKEAAAEAYKAAAISYFGEFAHPANEAMVSRTEGAG